MTTHTAEHAHLSPSGSKKWWHCPGSLTLEREFPNVSSEHANRGTACHWVAAECLRNKVPAAGFIGEYIPVDINDATRTVRCTEEMADLVQGYVDTIVAVSQGRPLLVEQRVDFSEFVGVDESFGTLDAGIHFIEQGELLVADLKSGHFPVDVKENSQLMLYALGLLRLLQDKAETEARQLLGVKDEDLW